VPVIAKDRTEGTLSSPEIREIISAAADGLAPDGKAVLVLTPDHTRTCPLPQVAREIHRAMAGRASKLDFLIALGTHPPLGRDMIARLLGTDIARGGAELAGSAVFNHEWNNADALTSIGTLPAAKISEITGGLFAADVDVTLNRMVLDYDIVLICGPVFPHEVVGFSGGAKYLFPGVCGPELLNFFHWLGAVITCPKIIGNKWTQVRKLLHTALAMVPVRTAALCMVVKDDGLAGLYFGGVEEAWSAAADLSARLHVTYVDKPFDSVLARAPEMYEDIWLAGKCMYKLECVVADGGELIIHAPHVRRFSATHGREIEQIGYHTRDYFLAQWEKFKGYPWGVLAHSTHVRGIGTYKDGVESPRVKVTLATGIPERTCRKVNLGYRDPASIDAADWQGRDDRLYVPKAGEMLYRLKNPPAWQVA